MRNTHTFPVAVWKLQHPLFQAGSLSKEHSVHSRLSHTTQLRFLQHPSFILYTFVFLCLLLATPGKCIRVLGFGRNMVQLLFQRIMSPAPVFKVAPPFLSVTWYHLGSNIFFSRYDKHKKKKRNKKRNHLISEILLSSTLTTQ